MIFESDSMKTIKDIKKMAIIGAGVMGHGIAEIYALIADAIGRLTP
jgi:ornithine cyclodeaminase/alanine dehydrogenase-like protein (mu-crystallin family)